MSCGGTHGALDVDPVHEHAPALAAAGPVRRGDVRGGERKREQEHGLRSRRGRGVRAPRRLQRGAAGEHGGGLGEHVGHGPGRARHDHPQVRAAAAAHHVRACHEKKLSVERLGQFGSGHGERIETNSLDRFDTHRG